MPINEKSALRQSNSTQLELFSRAKNIGTLTIYPPTNHLFSTLAAEALTLTKIPFKNKAIDLEFIYHEKHYIDQAPKVKDHDKQPAETFVWHTSQKNVTKAIFHGIGIRKVNALTAQVINALGAYQFKVNSRIYDNGIISNKYKQKKLFLKFTQKRVEALQGLERLVNFYDENNSIDDDCQMIADRLDDYIERIDAIKNHYTEKKLSDTLCQYDRHAHDKIIKEIESDKQKARQYKEWLGKRVAWYKKYFPDTAKQLLRRAVLDATGPNSIMSIIVKRHSIRATRQLEKHNQNMTYSFSAKSLLRGDMNSYCEDALKIIFDYEPDNHNPILHSHQGIYLVKKDDADDQKEQEKQITIDFSDQELNAKQTRQTLMAIAQIEGLDRIDEKLDENGRVQYVLVSNDHTKDLLTTRFTKWATQASVIDIATRTLYLFCNIISGIIAGLLFDLWVGFIGGLFKLKPPCLAHKLRLVLENDCNINTQFHELEKRVTMPIQSLGTKFGKLIGNLVRNTVYEFIKGFKIVFTEAKLDLIEGVKSDYTIGHHGIPDESDLISKIETELTELENEQTRLLEEDIPTEIKKLQQKNKKQDAVGQPVMQPIKHGDIDRLIADAPYELSPGEWHDMLNASANGIGYFFQSFTHEIHTKHPFTGFVFTLFYFAGGMAVLTPAWMAFLGPKYLAFSNALGATVGKSTISKALSSSLYQAQISTLILDTAMHGRDSIAANGLTMLEQDPSNVVLYAGLAFALGYLIAFQLNIPGVSAELRNDLPSVPIAGLMVTGAKAGILGYELLEAIEDKHFHEITDQDFRVRYKLKVKEICPELDIKKINEVVDEMLTDQNLFLIRLEKYKHLLPHISHNSKRELIELMRQKFPNNPQMRKAMMNQLFPESRKSILVITLTTIFSYVPMLLRCILTTPITLCIEPWLQLRDKLIKDITRLFLVVNKLAKMIVDHLKIMFRGLCDIVINEIIARFEGLVRDKTHSVSEISYSASSSFDCTYDLCREVFGAPLDAMKKASTSAHGHNLSQQHFNQGMFKFRKQQKSSKPEPVQQNSSSVDLRQ